MQLSSKVAVSVSAVVALVGAIAAAVATHRQQQERYHEFCDQGMEAMQLLALTVSPSVAENQHQRVQYILDNLGNFGATAFPDLGEVEVIDGDGVVVAARDPRLFNTRARSPEDLRATTSICIRGRVMTVVVPMRVTHPLGIVRASFDRRRLDDSLTRQQLWAMGLVVITMGLVAGALSLLHRRLVGARLARLAQAAAELGEGRLETRAGDGVDDEIGELGRSFDNMAQAIRLYTEDLAQIIAERTDELEAANTRLVELATTDQLTGLYNRRYFDEQARRALEVARRNERPVSVVLVDTDRFKSINDRFGHPAGDAILKDVAAVLRDNARKADLVARIGGEEFAVLMPEASPELAAQAAERMRQALASAPHPAVPELGDEPVTASFGVASLERWRDRLEDLLSLADQAMYESKAGGRNRVTVAAKVET